MQLLSPLRRPLLELGYQLGGWPRRVAALICLGLAVVATVGNRERVATAPRAPVVVVARDLVAGTVLRPGDLQLAHWASPDVPPKALTAVTAAVGNSIAAGMDRGEPVTTARLRGPGVTAGLPPGYVAVTVTISGPSALTLIRAGDTVDLLATVAPEAGGPGRARVVASAVRVLAALPARDDGSGAQTAALVVAVTRPAALAVASVVDGSMTATLRVPP